MAAIIYTLFGILRRFDITANLDIVRGFRANMLSDTLALRTYPELNLLTVGKDFLDDYADGIKKDMFRQLRRQSSKGQLGSRYLAALNELQSLGSRALIYASRFLERQSFVFGLRVNKTNFTILEVARLAAIIIGSTAVTVGAIAVHQVYHGIQPQFWPILRQALHAPAYQVVMGLVATISIRRVLVRLADPDID
jgi:hypothetical protein